VKKIFHFDSPRQPYRCDASVVYCFDHRFDLAVRKFLKREGVAQFDPIVVAGGAKSLASPENDSQRDFILDQISTSVRLHGTERVILFLHSDCGAYGGLAGKFKGDTSVEAAHLKAELRRSFELLQERYPQLAVDCFFVDFEGVWKLDTELTS